MGYTLWIKAKYEQLRLDLFAPAVTQLTVAINNSNSEPNNQADLTELSDSPRLRNKTYKQYKQLTESYYPAMLERHKAKAGARPPTYSNY